MTQFEDEHQGASETGEGPSFDFLPDNHSEQLQLTSDIEVQLSQWAVLAYSDQHPTRRATTLATTIVNDCSPKAASPEDIVSRLRFTNTLIESSPADQLEKERRHLRLALLVQHEGIDTIRITDPWFHDAFATAESYLTTYHTSEHYGDALTQVKRLYTIHQEIRAPRITRHSHKDPALTSFMVVLRELIEEL